MFVFKLSYSILILSLIISAAAPWILTKPPWPHGPQPPRLPFPEPRFRCKFGFARPPHFNTMPVERPAAPRRLHANAEIWRERGRAEAMLSWAITGDRRRAHHYDYCYYYHYYVTMRPRQPTGSRPQSSVHQSGQSWDRSSTASWWEATKKSKRVFLGTAQLHTARPIKCFRKDAETRRNGADWSGEPDAAGGTVRGEVQERWGIDWRVRRRGFGVVWRRDWRILSSDFCVLVVKTESWAIRLVWGNWQYFV